MGSHPVNTSTALKTPYAATVESTSDPTHAATGSVSRRLPTRSIVGAVELFSDLGEERLYRREER